MIGIANITVFEGLQQAQHDRFGIPEIGVFGHAIENGSGSIHPLFRNYKDVEQAIGQEKDPARKGKLMRLYKTFKSRITEKQNNMAERELKRNYEETIRRWAEEDKAKSINKCFAQHDYRNPNPKPKWFQQPLSEDWED